MILVSKVRKAMILIPSQDFAGEDGTMAEAMMRTTSLSNVSHERLNWKLRLRLRLRERERD